MDTLGSEQSPYSKELEILYRGHRTIRSTVRASLAALALSIVLLFASAGAAFAESPVALNGSHVLDQVSAVGGREAEITTATDSLYSKTKLQLYVVYVSTFSGVTDKTKWAAATAQENGLGSNDILLAVATVDRNYSIYYGRSSSLTAASTSAVEQNDIIPALKKNDWAGAAVAAADGYATAATQSSSNGQSDNSTQNNSTQNNPTKGFTAAGPVNPSGSGDLLLVFFTILVIVIAVGFFLYRRSRRRGTGSNGAPQVAPGPTQHELDQTSARLLVQLDDALKTSTQELEFAIAQFGNEATAPFTAALASAQSQVRQAFELRQKLDDAFPETADEKREMTQKIITLCTAADAELDEQAAAFNELRQLEKNIPQALSAVVSDAETARARLEKSRALLLALQQKYSASALSAIATNPDQAETLLQFVGGAGQTATSAMTSGDTGVAAVNVRAARASVDQTGHLLDAIDTLSAGLEQASAKLDSEIAHVRQDLTAAKSLPAGSPGVSESVSSGEAALAIATGSEGAMDPLASISALGAANSQLDGVLEAVRDSQEKARSARLRLPAALSTAGSQIAAASDFITTRRGAVGSEARTRLSEAVRRLDTATALSESDPVQAVAEATAAGLLAANALALAQDDTNSFGGFGGNGGMGGGGYGGGLGVGIGGAILGGLIGGVLGGGIRGGGGYGGDGFDGAAGGGFGGGGGFDGGGFGGGGFDGGGFGGSSGGSFGGGGGDSSGGGF